jgi:hypothetical protein
VTPTPAPRRTIGWLAVPAFLVVLALVGLGASAEGRSDFAERVDRPGDGRPADGATGGDIDGPAEPGRDGGEPVDGRGLERGSTEDERRVTIAGENGDIIVTVDGDRTRLRPVGRDEAVEIDPDDLVAVRLTEDGRLEVVPLDEVGPDDTVVTAADDGFDLRRPDGSLVEFRADGENGGITATEIGPDGTSTELKPDPDGSVTLSDGTTVGPIDSADRPGTFERIIDQTRNLPWPWIALGLVLLALASIALAIHLHRRRPTDGLDLGQLASPGVPDDQFEGFLAGLAADPDRSRAIRIGFSVAERGLGGVPTRRADETPFEWHHRVEGDRPDLGPPIGIACDLFARARFAPGQASEADRRALIDALRRLHHLDRRGTTHRAEPVEV